MHGPMDALCAEALSSREALFWLKINGYQRIVVETDNLLLADAVSKNIEYISPIGVILRDCKLKNLKAKNSRGIQTLFLFL